MRRRKPVRIILADPPLKEERYIYYHPTMGILYLIGAIKAAYAADEVEVRYLQGVETLQSHLEEIEKFAPDIYGISFKTPMARLAYKTIDAVKSRFPSLTVIAGGAHVSAMPDETMAQTLVDACFTGECEESIVQAIAGFAHGRVDYGQIQGVVYRRNEEVISNPARPFRENIDDFAWPAWDRVDFRSFNGMPYMKGYPFAGVVVSRGCPYQCTFCSEPVWKLFKQPSYRQRMPEAIVDEIRYLYGRGIKEIRLWCEEFNADTKWAVEVLERIADLGYDDLFINFNLRGDNVTPRLVEAMKAANVWLVSIGMESASNQTLKGIKKEITVDSIERSCRLISNAGIKVLGYFQFFLAWEEDGRLCWETDKEAARSINWAYELNRKGLLHYMATAVATPRPCTEMWDLAKQHNLFKVPTTTRFSYLTEGMNLPGVTPSQVRWSMLKANWAKIRIGLRSGNVNRLNIGQFLHMRLMAFFS